jgi:SAM-dependent methyltransferase
MVMAKNGVVGKCVACRGDLALFGPRLSYAYYRCVECATIQLYPQPSAEDIINAYKEDYASSGHHVTDPALCAVSARPYYENILKVIRDYHISGQIVDYGAGWGGLCKLLIEKGYNCLAVEPSREMAEYCQQGGLPTRNGELGSIADLESQVDALVLCTVLEHLTNHDEWLREARKLLSPKGFLITLQPTAHFANFAGNLLRLNNHAKPLPQVHQVFCPPWHTVFFSSKGARALAERSGFKLLEVRPAPQGRREGLLGLAQVTLESINRVGYLLAGNDWPLIIAHTYVFGKN